jgi:GNAT superfamily N-acetyltransferase
MRITPVTADDAERLREIRLRALADDPHAFCATLESEVAKPAAWWEEKAARSEAGDSERIFVAHGENGWCGMAAAYTPEDGNVPVLWGMWVAPQARGHGVGRGLVEAVADWARENGAPRLDLSVIEGNAPAEALFEATGFRATGERQPIDSERIEVFMTHPLA